MLILYFYQSTVSIADICLELVNISQVLLTQAAKGEVSETLDVLDCCHVSMCFNAVPKLQTH